MKLHLLLLLSLLLPSGLAAQDLAGVWDGTLSADAARLPVVFRIDRAGSGYRATLDSPDQGIRGIAVDSLSFRGGELSLRIAAFNASFRGALLPGGMIVGSFTQFGRPFSLVLTRRKPPVRSQTPRPPFPYSSREVSFPSRAGGGDACRNADASRFGAAAGCPCACHGQRTAEPRRGALRA